MSRKLNYTVLDVFTSSPFQGNQLAVVDVPSSLELAQDAKQKIAREFNFSETVFLHERTSQEQPRWQVNIFTTNEELPFAGHPTVGTATLISLRHPELDHATLVAKAGPIEIDYSNLWDGTAARASIPHDVHTHAQPVPKSHIIKQQPAISAELTKGPDGYPVVSPVKGMTFALVKLPSLESLSRISTSGTRVEMETDPDWSPSFSAVYYYCQTKAEPGQGEVHTRMIESSLEDAGTGSAACTLAAHLAGGRSTHFHIIQGEDMGRRCDIHVDVECDESGKIRTIHLSGTAVDVMSGTLTIPYPAV